MLWGTKIVKMQNHADGYQIIYRLCRHTSYSVWNDFRWTPGLDTTAIVYWSRYQLMQPMDNCSDGGKLHVDDIDNGKLAFGRLMSSGT